MLVCFLGPLAGIVGCAPTSAVVTPPPGAALASSVGSSSPSEPIVARQPRAFVVPTEEATPGASDPVTVEPTPPEVPSYFEGRDRVTYQEFIDELRTIADEFASHPAVIEAHRALLAEKGLTQEELPLQSFSRARLAFESARDSGLWGIRGTVTDQMPWSDRIWEQWKERAFSTTAPLADDTHPIYPTAVAECDELGALFAILARDLGVVGFVGLHWPYWNHVVPVWQVTKTDGSFVRIIVPATQTFLDSKDTMGTVGLPLNRVVFPYSRRDRKPEMEMAADLARFLLTQSRTYGELTTEEFTQRRLHHRWKYRPDASEK